MQKRLVKVEWKLFKKGGGTFKGTLKVSKQSCTTALLEML